VLVNRSRVPTAQPTADVQATADTGDAVPLLRVTDLSVAYRTRRGDVGAVDHVSFDLQRGEFLGIVGESGCGKSTQLATIRWKELSVVMQSAMNALNPVKSIGAQFADAMRAHGVSSKQQIADRSAEVLRMVGIDPTHLRSYPHQLSGGMRQRSMIAMALLFTPDLVIMDEPTSALDVVAQRSLMVQIKELQRQLSFAVLFVTHDMSLVSHFSDRLLVMYAGQVAELGATGRIFDTPLHPYTRGLLDAFPSVRGPKVSLTGIPGSPPDLARPPDGCRFAPRCPLVADRCREQAIDLFGVDDVLVRCINYRNGVVVGD
jgi:oligopeptide/dipeptide ABC transporter ATP-binding protein